MKRMSIAEQTLKKQIEGLDAQLDKLDRMMGDLRVQAQTMMNMKRDLETEQSRLQAQRITASERVNP